MVDNVNHPQHYQSRSGLETIDIIAAVTEDLSGMEAVCTANVVKYISRWKKKNGLEDLKKAQWYLNKLIDIVESDCKLDHTNDILAEFYGPLIESFKEMLHDKEESNNEDA